MCCKWISGGGEKEEERTARDVEIFMVMRMWRRGDLGIEGFSWETWQIEAVVKLVSYCRDRR